MEDDEVISSINEAQELINEVQVTEVLKCHSLSSSNLVTEEMVVKEEEMIIEAKVEEDGCGGCSVESDESDERIEGKEMGLKSEESRGNCELGGLVEGSEGVLAKCDGIDEFGCDVEVVMGDEVVVDVSDERVEGGELGLEVEESRGDCELAGLAESSEGVLAKGDGIDEFGCDMEAVMVGEVGDDVKVAGNLMVSDERVEGGELGLEVEESRGDYELGGLVEGSGGGILAKCDGIGDSGCDIEAVMVDKLGDEVVVTDERIEGKESIANAELAGLVEGSGEAILVKCGGIDVSGCDIEAVMIDKVGDEVVVAGNLMLGDERIEGKELGLKSEESIENAELAGLVESSGEGMAAKSGGNAVSGCESVIDHAIEAGLMDNLGDEVAVAENLMVTDERIEGEELGLKSEESIRSSELAGSVEGSGAMMACESVIDHATEEGVIASREEDKLGNDVVVAENLMVSETAAVIELGQNGSVELQETIVIEKNEDTEIAQMSRMEMDLRVDGEIGNGDSVVFKLDDSGTDTAETTTADCDETKDDDRPDARGKMEMDICAESNMPMGEGSKSEHDSTPRDAVVGTEAVVVSKDEKDEVEEAVTEENLVDVSEKEKEKQVELVESDVSQHKKVDVKGELGKNDECKDMEGNSLFEDNKLDDEREVGMNVEECIDSKEDSESTVSESHADKSGKDNEVEGAKEVATGDIRMETEADTMEITKDKEPEDTGDSDAPQTPKDEEMVAEEETNVDTEVETETDVAESEKAASGKRKRGKNSSANPKSTLKARKTIEEDVCFICFDGGELVLCDRRGCPKAYHPYCVNRDDSFFHGKGTWSCGCHQCSICEKKNPQYFCYTCPYSLCKGCCKDGVLSIVRGKKGFCEICIKVIELLENSELGVKNDEVDFHDKGCWEFLFRDYYIELKSKLSLSSAEIAEAKRPWKDLDTSAGKDYKLRSGMQGNLDVKQKSPEPPSDLKDDAENSNENEEAIKPRRKKVKKRPKTRGKKHTSSSAAESISDEDDHVVTEWASKELLDFVMHMKSGDRSILSEFDVQALLLEYIKRNNLRDPRQKSKIICDSRLQSLFGKPRVGHFEMLKLLESHFFVKDDSHTDQRSVVDTNSEQLEVDGNADTPRGTKEKKRKSRKKGGRRGRQSNLDDYAAIDIHNISLIYLRRKLMEDLLEDSETFKDKIAGTFVRIRISGSAQKQDIYRLVQVVGTNNAAEPYKVGKRTTNIMVEILNLNKTEVIPIDTISNQDFTEDECKRLRQSIKCGLINRLTVGDIRDKAIELQTAKVNDWLETEVTRLSHLRDRASDMGHKKELRECVEKLQLLKTPEERQRRLDDEIPEIHVDPKMDPTYESEEDDTYVDETRQDVNTKIRGPGSRGGRGQISPGSDILSKDPWSGGSRYLNKNWELDTSNNRELDRNLSSNSRDNTTHFGEVQDDISWNQVRDHAKPESSNLDKLGSTIVSDAPGGKIHDVPKSESLSSLVLVPTQAPALAKEAELIKINESEKNWHYKDPSGKVQGPFSMVQLRKWNNTGYFPSELKVWRTTEKQEDSITLTDALEGKFKKESTAAHISLPSTLSASAITLPSTLSANLTNIMASLEYAREQQDREKLKTDRDASGNLLSHIVSPTGGTDPSVGHPKFSTERYIQSESSGHPSPTPILNNNAHFTREGGSLSSATSYFARNGALPSPTAVSPEYQGRSSIPTSGLRSGETLQASENEPVSTGSSGVQVGLSVVSNTSQNLHTVVNSEGRAMHVQGNVAVGQDSFAPQIVNNQNPIVGTLGWGGAQSQKVDANAAIPLQPQIQAYGQWGNIPAATGYTHPGNFPQGNQPNMHFPALPNSSWSGATENNTTTVPTPRPENQNQNPDVAWGVMQGNQNAVWMGAPPINGNVNWGAGPLQGPPPANQIMGWTMPPANMGAAVQGQLPGGANPGWTAGTGNPPVQGLPPAGNVNQNWVAPHTVNAPSNVHMPASGSGWPPNPGNLHAPVRGPVPGNVNQGLSTPRGPVPGNGNQGLSAPPGSQGPWVNDQNHSRSKFSGQRDQSSEYGYGGNRSRNRPSSFGNGGPGGPSRQQFAGRRQMPCPYNNGGRCRKGASCNYVHT